MTTKTTAGIIQFMRQAILPLLIETTSPQYARVDDPSIVYDGRSTFPLLLETTGGRLVKIDRHRYYWWFFGYVAKLPYERETGSG